jgi:hypothetical protein
MKLRLWLRQQRYRLLNRFAEVRELRKLRTDFELRCREVYAKELEQRNHAAHADIERAKAERQLADANRALEVMTEARLNSDRAVDVLRGQLEVMAATHASEILRMQQMTDWFGLEGRGRQVFGTAPLATKPKETDDSPGPGKILGRHVVQQQTAAFIQQAEEMMKKGVPLPNGGPEYSSTSRAVAVAESVA